MQDSPVVVTDQEIGAIRSTVMAGDPSTEEPGFDSRTCCEHIVVFTATTLEALQLDPDDAACPDKLGAMTANAFGYSNTAEAFIAIEVRLRGVRGVPANPSSCCHCNTRL